MVEGKTAQHPVAVFLLLFGFGAMSGCECRPAELLFGGQPDSNDLRKESVDGSAADAGRFRKMECKVSYTYDVGWRDRKLIESSPGRFGYEGDGVVASAEIAAATDTAASRAARTRTWAPRASAADARPPAFTRR